MQLSIETLRHAFVARLAEWLLACVMFMWGVVVLMPSPLFDGDNWAAFREIISETTFGVICVAIGLVRLAVLAANGAWRPMYYLRSLLALVCFTMWVAFVLGFLSVGTVSTWLAVYPTFAIFDAFNVFRAMRDAANYELSRRQAKVPDGTAA